ncbi:MAG: tetratricopeptide repeat protein [Nitrospinota bacterium]
MNLAPRLLLIAACVIAVFGRTAGFDFVWDDYDFIVNNDEIKNLSNIPSFFTESTAGLYRPMRTVLYAFGYAAFGLNPGLYHLFGLILHIAASILVYRLIALLVKSDNAALFGALVFALHPVHIEKIIFVTSVFDIPGDISVLAAVYFYAKYRTGGVGKNLRLTFLFFTFGLFFSETVTALPFILAAMEVTVFCKKEDTRERTANFALFFIILAAYIALRTAVIGRVGRPPDAVDYWSIQAMMQYVYLYYWRLLAIPWPLSPVAPLEPMEPICAYCIAALAVNIAMLGAAWRARAGVPLAALAVFWFYTSILPNSNLIPTGTLMAERYLYIPSVGLSLMAAHFYGTSSRFKKPAVFLVLALLALLSFVQAGNWRNGETLWKSALKVSPESVIAWRNLGAWYRENGRMEEAVKVYTEMLSKGVGTTLALSELAAYAIDAGKFELAEKQLGALVRLEPGNAAHTTNLIVARCQLNRPGWREEAGRLLKKRPSAFLYEQVGTCHAKAGERERAMDAFEQGLALDPANESIKRKIRLLEGSVE